MGDEEATPAIVFESLITRVPGHRLGRHVVFTHGCQAGRHSV